MTGSRRGRILPGVTTPSTANPVSATAYWTLASRAEDASRERPIADDRFAHRFMNDDARAVAKRLASLKKPYSSFPVRHRIIDDLLAAELSADPDLRVVLIGSGFDSRPFRLQGGRWLEVDEPDLLAYKESRLPAAGVAAGARARSPSASARSRSSRCSRPTHLRRGSRSCSRECSGI